MYKYGLGVSKDYAKAAECFRKSAERGLDLDRLVVINKYGLDSTKALERCRKDAEQGNADAQCCVGEMYEKGRGISIFPNYAKAAEWYRKSAEQGYATALYKMGIMYEQGRGISQDYVTAAEWYRKSAEQGIFRDKEYPAYYTDDKGNVRFI